MADNEFLVVLSTCPDAATAEALARAALEGDHAACVNIVPAVRSMYVWKGELQVDSEVLMVIKTTAGRFRALRDLLVERHPYDVPEVVALRVTDGHHAYLEWLADPRRTPSPPGA